MATRGPLIMACVRSRFQTAPIVHLGSISAPSPFLPPTQCTALLGSIGNFNPFPHATFPIHGPPTWIPIYVTHTSLASSKHCAQNDTV